MPDQISIYKEKKVPRIISVFNNKGGVGKTTLTYHLSAVLNDMGLKVLIIDLDPQCNLTIYGMNQEELHDIWEKEDQFIDVVGFEEASKQISPDEFKKLNISTRSIHYLLKPTEEGTGELEMLPPPKRLENGVDLIPGRLTLHMYEEKIASRWSDAYRGDPLAIRTITKIRELAQQYISVHSYDIVILDTSPSLGALNKTVISTVDGFFIPCMPDLFSLYGIRNIGNSLNNWKKEFEILFSLISGEKRKRFPRSFVSFLGFTIFNAKKYGNLNEYNLAQAHYNYVTRIPETIKKFIHPEVRTHLTEEMIDNPIGGISIMHSHNTLPNMAQKYRMPIWKVPSLGNRLESTDSSTINGNRRAYEATLLAYKTFANAVLERVNRL